jgi:hypothetical protein
MGGNARPRRGIGGAEDQTNAPRKPQFLRTTPPIKI